MRQEGLWGSLSESRNTNSSKLVERPLGLVQGLGAGREGDRFYGESLLGLALDKFQGQAAVLWNEAGFCGPLKKTPTAQQSDDHFF